MEESISSLFATVLIPITNILVILVEYGIW